jgi:hypothetical protein
MAKNGYTGFSQKFDYDLSFGVALVELLKSIILHRRFTNNKQTTLLKTTLVT